MLSSIPGSVIDLDAVDTYSGHDIELIHQNSPHEPHNLQQQQLHQQVQQQQVVQHIQYQQKHDQLQQLLKKQKNGDTAVEYRFSHDRMQQACMCLLSPEQQRDISVMLAEVSF